MNKQPLSVSGKTTSNVQTTGGTTGTERYDEVVVLDDFRVWSVCAKAVVNSK